MMKTALIVCTDNPETLSHQFLDTLQEKHLAQHIIASDFKHIDTHITSCNAVDHVVILPCVIGLSESQHQDMQNRINALQNQHPSIGIHLANPLGCDPRLIEMIQDRLSTALKGTQNAPILTIEGLGDTQTYDFADLQALSDQISDVSTQIPDRQGQGVWVRAILPNKANAQATFFADDDRFSAAVSLQLVREKGLFIYALNNEPLPTSFGGPLRLLIPNHSDRCANVKGVARIVLSEP